MRYIFGVATDEDLCFNVVLKSADEKHWQRLALMPCTWKTMEYVLSDVEIDAICPLEFIERLDMWQRNFCVSM